MTVQNKPRPTLAIWNVAWPDLDTALTALNEFPVCALCGAPAKAQPVGGEWLTLCSAFPQHNGLRRSFQPKASNDNGKRRK